MLKFKKFSLNSVKRVQKYTKSSPYLVCDLTGGVLYMWNDVYNLEYAEFQGALILKSNFKNKYVAFFPPLGDNFDLALSEIERYAEKNHLPLNFMCVEDEVLEKLSARYGGKIESEYHRDWSDYVYDFEEIKNFQGKKFSGQRNHINGFKKAYPNHEFKKIKSKDLPRIKEFLKEYRKEHKGGGRIEKNEYLNTLMLVDNFNSGNFFGGYMEIDKKICSFTIGEYAGKSLIIHIEKALKSYRGIYPATFNAFAKMAEKEGILYINREDDSGDLGLRTSKTQYHPIMLVNKNFVSVKKPMQIKTPPVLKGERVTLSKITKKDKDTYFKLYVNKTLNKYWGYDYKKDVPSPSPDAFYNMQLKDFKNQDVLCLAVRVKGEMIGEAVLHNFTYDGKVEVGIRIFKKHFKKGYGTEAVKLISEYAETVLNKTPVAKCYLKNTASLACLQRAGFKVISSDKKFNYLGK